MPSVLSSPCFRFGLLRQTVPRPAQEVSGRHSRARWASVRGVRSGPDPLGTPIPRTWRGSILTGKDGSARRTPRPANPWGVPEPPPQANRMQGSSEAPTIRARCFNLVGWASLGIPAPAFTRRVGHHRERAGVCTGIPHGIPWVHIGKAKVGSIRFNKKGGDQWRFLILDISGHLN